MKKILCLLAIGLSLNFLAQAPEKMSYQAVVRNSDNQLVLNNTVGLKISILQGSPSGTAVYEEAHAPVTNGNGLFSIEVGNGTVVSGTFSLIDWKTGLYWLQTEVDPLGGTDYSITAVSQLLSVPYAFHSKYADLSGSGIDNIIDNGDGTLTFEFVNGTDFTSPVLTGLAGENGTNGTDGVSVLSANIQNDSLYVSLSNGQTVNAGYVKGTQGSAGIQGLAGTNGTNGTPGTNGLNGTNGADGVSVLNTYIQNDSLRLVLSNGQTINAGLLAGVSITNTVIQNDSLIVSLSNGQTINAGYLNCPGQNAFLPNSNTISIQNIGSQSVSVNSNYTSNGNELVFAHGTCISTNPNPTFNDKKNTYIGTPEMFDTMGTNHINLLPNTHYFVRSFTTNVKGTVYGNELSFTTLPPCEAPGTYNCTINIIVIGGSPYSSTTNGTLVFNNDMSFVINFNDPNAPFPCNTNLAIPGQTSCEYNPGLPDINLTTGGCTINANHAYLDYNTNTLQLPTVFINGDQYSFSITY